MSSKSEVLQLVRELLKAIEATEAALKAKDEEIARLKKALDTIAELGVCDCDCYDDEPGCSTCIAMDALGAAR